MGRGTVFLGRERELGELGTALDQLAAGRGSLVLLVGEPGIGKTRLADEACALAASHGVAAHWGRCWESGGAPAYWPWAQIVSALWDEGAPSAGEAQVLAAIVPERSPVAAGLGAAGDPEAARFQIFRAVAALLARASRQRPLVLVLDDLHAADQSSLLLLRFLARELRSTRLLVLGTYRDVEARLSRETGQLLAQVGREAQTLQLGRLGSTEVASFVRAVAGDVPDATVTSIFEATHGNPLFVDELVRTLVASGELARGARPVELALPFGVREAIRQHIARLSAEDRAVVEVASVLGNEVRPALLATAAALPRQDVEATVDRAVALGILVERGRRRYGFGHGLICEALYRDLPNSRRMELHARVAEALDRDPGDPERPWAALAHHLLEAGPAFVERAVPCAIRAAERALDAVAYEDALTILERARAGTELAAPSDKTRAELCLAESLACARSGDTARGRALCLQAVTLARAVGDSELGARVALGYGAEFSFGLVDPQLVALLREALAALPATDSSLRARVMARLASALQPADAPQEPIEAAREAIAMARRTGDRPTLMAVIHAGMAAMMDFVHPDERLPLNSEALALAAELGDRPRALRATARLVFDHLERGDLERADARIEAHERLARELRSTRALWQTPLMRALRANMEGHFADADRFADEARALGGGTPDFSLVSTLALHRFGLYRAREAHEELDRLRPELVAVWNRLNLPEWIHPLEGAIHARLGRKEEAAESLRQCVLARIPQKADEEGLGLLAETCAAAGDRALAAELYPRVVHQRDCLLSWGIFGMFCEGPYERHLGLLAALLGRTEDAVRHLEAAAARTRGLGLRPHLARVLYEQGRVLVEGAREGAPARLAEARALATELGLTGLLRQIDALAGAAPAAPAANGAPPRFALRREGDYWTVTCDEGALHLKDTRGLQTLHRLLTHPDREFHAADLAADAEGPRDGGDAGELLDREARDAYRTRLEDLEEERREAEQFGDTARAGRARQEIELLAGELARAVGLGGRERKAGSAAERARVTVQKRVRDAIRKIEEGAPALGRHLAMTVQTGTYCAYRPGGRFR